MILKSYYDASGKAIDPQCRTVTLGGYVASDIKWPELDSAFETALSRSKYPCPRSDRGNPYFHSKEAFHRQKGFRDWTAEMVESLVNDLLQVLGEQGRTNLIGFSCTVNKADYKKVKLSIPNLRSIEQICLYHCIGHSLRHPDLPGNGMEIYFDRDEEFEEILKRAWKEEINGEPTSWAKDVLQIGAVTDMRYSYGIQAADLLAWASNRYYTHGAGDEFGGNFFMLNLMNAQYFAYYDEEKLRDTFNPDGTMRVDRVGSPQKVNAPYRIVRP